MDIITIYKRFENESDEELVYRICKDKEQIGSWQSVANVINELTGNDYGESTYRKKFQAFQKMLEANQSKFIDSDAQLKEIEIQKRELERERIKFRDQRRSWNKQNYENTRFDEVMELLEERLDNFSRTDFSVQKDIPISFDSDSMIVCLSDLHIGQTFSSVFGEYNSDIAKDRLEKYLNEIIAIGKLHNVNRVYVTMLGDCVSGALHKTIEVSNKENVIDQLKLSIEYITSFCYELTKYFNVYLTSSSGNHSRLQAKDLAQHSERLDAFIAWDVCRVLENNDNFHSLLHRSIDDGIADLCIDGKSYLCVHGDWDETSKNGYMKLSSMCGFFPEYVLCGHKHFCMMNQETKFIQSGSLASAGDDYTIEKRLTGKASQMICIVNKNGVKACYPVILS